MILRQDQEIGALKEKITDLVKTLDEFYRDNIDGIADEMTGRQIDASNEFYKILQTAHQLTESN